jgi:hypothetical protein
MKILLTLHEAIAVVLIGKPKRTASFQEIADVIEKRGLFPIRGGGISLSKQVELRSIQTQGRYNHLFEFISPDRIKLK